MNDELNGTSNYYRFMQLTYFMLIHPGSYNILLNLQVAGTIHITAVDRIYISFSIKERLPYVQDSLYHQSSVSSVISKFFLLCNSSIR
jgi:hypothetical protein